MYINHTNTQEEINEILSLIDPSHVIPVLEIGIELTKLQAQVEEDPKKFNDRIRTSRILLSLLYARKFTGYF